jgi:hypothetical protein
MTLDTYGHLVPTSQAVAAAKADEIFRPRPEDGQMVVKPIEPVAFPKIKKRPIPYGRGASTWWR